MVHGRIVESGGCCEGAECKCDSTLDMVTARGTKECYLVRICVYSS